MSRVAVCMGYVSQACQLHHLLRGPAPGRTESLSLASIIPCSSRKGNRNVEVFHKVFRENPPKRRQILQKVTILAAVFGRSFSTDFTIRHSCNQDASSLHQPQKFSAAGKMNPSQPHPEPAAVPTEPQHAAGRFLRISPPKVALRVRRLRGEALGCAAVEYLFPPAVPHSVNHGHNDKNPLCGCTGD